LFGNTVLENILI